MKSIPLHLCHFSKRLKLISFFQNLRFHLDHGFQYISKYCKKCTKRNIYSIMGDKSSDISSKEQVVLCMANDDLEIYEDFLVF